MLNIQIENLEKDLKFERVDKALDKENYKLLYERFVKLSLQ